MWFRSGLMLEQRSAQRNNSATGDDAVASLSQHTGTALGKGLLLLEELALAADQHETLGVSELARRAGTVKSTTHRLLVILCEFGFVEQRKDGSYQLGLRMFEMGNRVTRREILSELALPHLFLLRDTVEETAHLGVMVDDPARTDEAVMYLEKVESRNSIRMASQVGHRNPVHCTALGKTLLAFASPEIRDTTLARGEFPRRTERTLVRADQLAAELTRIRHNGFGVDNEELERGLRCLAAPVFDVRGSVVAAVSISGPTTRITLKAIAALAVHVMNAAKGVSASLGHRAVV